MNRHNPSNSDECIRNMADRFRETGIDTARLDAEILVSHALGTERYSLALSPERDLSAQELHRMEGFAERRLRGEPVAYILNGKEFYSLNFFVDRRVLIPRPETELLVDLALYHAPMNGHVLDLGTGSGAIAVAVKHNRGDCTVLATDISDGAIAVASRNAAEILGSGAVEFRHGDLFAPVEGLRFDVIVSNPPYVDSSDMQSLQRELSFEPGEALFAGDGGTSVIRRIIGDAPCFLSPSGVLLIEIGEAMRNFVKARGVEAGFHVSVLNDYAGLPRVAVLTQNRMRPASEEI